LRRVVRGDLGRTTESKPLSSLEQQLAKRLGRRTDAVWSGVPGRRRPSRAKMRAARQRVEERMERDQSTQGQDGRWTLVHRAGVLGKELGPEERALQQCRQLLARYGVVAREWLDREIGAWDWSMIYRTLQQMEMRGEVRRGYFVQGLSGAQFAMPDVVEELRSVSTAGDDENVVLMNSCDPANLFGPSEVDGPLCTSGEPLTFQRIPSTWLVLHRGLPVLLVESSGANLTTTQGSQESILLRAIQRWLEHLSTFDTRTSVKLWDGDPVLGSPGASLLEAAGFYRDYEAMSWSGAMVPSRSR
jgi:ATP-dependent Lhr-like helicase